MRGSTAGLAEGTIITPDTVHAAFLVFLDVMFSSLLAAPAVIAYWRGTWNLIGIFLFPDDVLLNAISSCVIGTVGHFIFYYYQRRFSKSFHPDKHRITFMIISRIYTAIYGVVCVNGWRGGWSLMDLYIPKKVHTYFAILMISCILLAFCKGLRNISASPLAISTDHSKDYFAVPTMFKASVRIAHKNTKENVKLFEIYDETCNFCALNFRIFVEKNINSIKKISINLYFFSLLYFQPITDPGFFFTDCTFSVLVIGTLVVFVWRSMFALCDLLIYPTNESLSAFYSLVS